MLYNTLHRGECLNMTDGETAILAELKTIKALLKGLYAKEVEATAAVGKFKNE